jgi:hypothetical protein
MLPYLSLAMIEYLFPGSTCGGSRSRAFFTNTLPRMDVVRPDASFIQRLASMCCYRRAALNDKAPSHLMRTCAALKSISDKVLTLKNTRRMRER